MDPQVFLPCVVAVGGLVLNSGNPFVEAPKVSFSPSRVWEVATSSPSTASVAHVAVGMGCLELLSIFNIVLSAFFLFFFYFACICVYVDDPSLPSEQGIDAIQECESSSTIDTPTACSNDIFVVRPIVDLEEQCTQAAIASLQAAIASLKQKSVSAQETITSSPSSIETSDEKVTATIDILSILIWGPKVDRAATNAHDKAVIASELEERKRQEAKKLKELEVRMGIEWNMEMIMDMNIEEEMEAEVEEMTFDSDEEMIMDLDIEKEMAEAEEETEVRFEPDMEMLMDIDIQEEMDQAEEEMRVDLDTEMIMDIDVENEIAQVEEKVEMRIDSNMAMIMDVDIEQEIAQATFKRPSNKLERKDSGTYVEMIMDVDIEKEIAQASLERASDSGIVCDLVVESLSAPKAQHTASSLSSKDQLLFATGRARFAALETREPLASVRDFLSIAVEEARSTAIRKARMAAIRQTRSDLKAQQTTSSLSSKDQLLFATGRARFAALKSREPLASVRDFLSIAVEEARSTAIRTSRLAAIREARSALSMERVR